MFPILTLALSLAFALVVALVADRMGLLRHVLRARHLRAASFAFVLVLGLMTAAAVSPIVGCATSPQARAARQQTLSAVVSRVDVARLLDCSKHGFTKDAAKCLGAAALTEGLEEAMHQATLLAEAAQEAGNPHAGAADMDADQEAALAADLDSALDELAFEIAAANTLAAAE